VQREVPDYFIFDCKHANKDARHALSLDLDTLFRSELIYVFSNHPFCIILDQNSEVKRL
jgi:hypothetical protein